MKTIALDNTTCVYVVKASSFPAGIQQAFNKLYSMFPKNSKRKYYGISHPAGDGSILYWAAAEKLADDANDLETFIIQKGNYAVIDIHNFMKHPDKIGKAFGELIRHPQLDPNGACIEVYNEQDNVRCMVKLKD